MQCLEANLFQTHGDFDRNIPERKIRKQNLLFILCAENVH
jgi:hypothetical protein